MSSASLTGLVTARLAAHPPAVAGADEVVVAAFEDDGALRRALLHEGQPASPTDPAALAAPAAAFLAGIEVEGFRGVGPPVTLNVPPGPGLTLIVGRNGSGKSSLAEALEMLLTGANRRWSGRSAIWTAGWRNLHHGPPRITAHFLLDGQARPMTVTRTWPDEAGLEGSQLTIDGKRRSLAERGWEEALRSYPPLLSHNELGRVLEGRPTELYDALASILGLGDIAAAGVLLRSVRLELEGLAKAVQREAAELADQLALVEDERAAAARTALTTKPWDVAAIERLLAGGVAAEDRRTELRTLRELSTLPVVERARVRQSVARLREVDEELARVGGSDAAAAREIALLLEQALRAHAPHQGLDCPVCGTGEVLTYEWRLRTGERIEHLRAEAASVEAVHRRAAAVRAEALALVTPIPTALREAATVGVEADGAVAAWERWSAPPRGEDSMALSVHLDTVAAELIGAVAAVRAIASAELERREDRWRPAAQVLAAWLPRARDSLQQQQCLPRLRAAEQWVRDAHEDLRRQRFAPIAEAVQANWSELRQNSSVQLGDLRLEGTATANSRRLTLDVTIDGDGASALGVMSQGELNCLALSLFLPRAAMPESPFRFMVIDDPVQAMDPVKVEGLARVLGRVARDRQVVVLTHDDRLPEAVRRLTVDATVIEVSRREQSVVELRPFFDPVTRHIDDAMAIAQTTRLPVEARRVVPGFCRMAIEAACVEAVTRRLLRAGIGHDVVAATLAEPTTTRMWLALALLRDAARSGDVQPWLETNAPWAVAVVRLANRGSHTELSGDPVALVRAAERLCTLLRKEGPGGG